MTFATCGERTSVPSRSLDPASRIHRQYDPALANTIGPSLGNQQMQALLGPSSPSNLAISQPGDPSELEAERIAGEIVHANASPSCSAGEPCQCDGCLQRRASGGGTTSAEAPLSINSPGHSLDETTRAFFEPRFGRDLSGVRVHTGHDASRSARALGAHAYTVGHNIVFGEGRYAPDTESGKQLLAHELVHTVQQQELSGVHIQRAWYHSPLEFLTMVIAGVDLDAIAIHAAPTSVREAETYAPGGHDYGPQNALRHCILAGLLASWGWKAALAEIGWGTKLTLKGLFSATEIIAYGALMGERVRLFLWAHEKFSDDGCGNYGTATIDSECDRHNNEVGLSIGGPFTSDATVISEAKAALDGGTLWMTPGPTTLTYTVSTALWRTSPWMIPTPQQVDCSKVVFK
jgi:uncharacterized protein DUF4157